MTKRKPVDEVRWAWVGKDGKLLIVDKGCTEKYMEMWKHPHETVIRVRVTEVPKKRKGKR